MKMSPNIKFYKKVISTMNYKQVRYLISNSRLSKEERTAVELADLKENPNKISANIMNTDERQFNTWLHKARQKITKQILR